MLSIVFFPFMNLQFIVHPTMTISTRDLILVGFKIRASFKTTQTSVAVCNDNLTYSNKRASGNQSYCNSRRMSFLKYSIIVAIIHFERIKGYSAFM